MLKKLASGSVGVFLLISPLVASAQTTSVQAQIDALLKLVAQLQAQIMALQGQSPASPTAPSQCLYLNNSLIIGSTDATTSGEVTKLQQFLIAAGVYPEALVTGYYGNLTAQAVMKWQRAHGMDFVTLTSGVGPMTRAKMQESCAEPATHSIQSVTWKASVINPNAPSYQANEQNITLDVLYQNGGTKMHTIGSAYGCPAVTAGTPTTKDGKKLLGAVSCYYSLSGTQFIAYVVGDKIIIEKGTESAKDGSVTWVRVLEVPAVQ